MTDPIVRGLTITTEQKLVTETCCKCGILFAMTADLNRQLRNDFQGKAEAWFFCPRGHRQYYTGKSEAQKLRDQLEEERRQRQRAEQRVAEWADDARQAREQAEHERRRANGYKGHATRITKRAKAGVCPCCNRSFINMARHMATKHPQFTPLEVIEGGKADAA